MKKSKFHFFFLVISATLLLLLTSCSKDEPMDKDPDKDSDTLTISSFIPSKPMWGDIITIEGSGFGNKKSEIEVYFPGNNNLLSDSIKTKGEIIEVSNSLIKVKIPYITELMADGYIYPIGLHNGWGNIIVKVKGKTTFTSTDRFVNYRAVPFIEDEGINPSNTADTYIIPGEKIVLTGKGFGITVSEGILTINGITVTIDSVKNISEANGEGSSKLIATIPPALGSKSNNLKEYTFIYTRYDRSYSRTVSGQSLPKLSLTTNTLPASINSSSSSTNFVINGRNLYANRIRFSDGGFSLNITPVGNGLSATQLNANIPINLLSPRGNRTYTVTLFDTELGGTTWNLGTITIIP